MIITAPSQKDEFIVSPPRFQLDPPGESPFEAVPATSVTSEDDSFRLSWVEKRPEGEVSSSDLLARIVARSGQDVERFPSSADAHANYALALMNSGDMPRAVDEFSVALRLSPGHSMSLANLARIRMAQGRFEEAVQLLQELSQAHPTEPSPLVNMSYIFLRAGNFQGANAVLEKAIDIDRDAVLPRYLMAVSLLMSGKPQDAIRHLRVAARAEVRSPTVHQALGVAYLIAGDVKGAVRSFKAALTLAPGMRDAIHALANVLLERGDLQNLVELLTAYLERCPADISAREILATAYSETRDFPRARLELTTALRYVVGEDEGDRKQRAKLLNNIGVCFDGQKDLENAMHWFERSISVDPAFSPVPYLNVVKVHRRKGQFGQASRVLESCRAIFPEDDEVNATRAWILGEQEFYDAAIDLLRKRVLTGRAGPSSYAVLGWYLADARHDLEAARRVLSEGLQRYPKSPGVVNNLAYVLLMDGRPLEARSVLSSFESKSKTSLEERVVLTATWGLLHLWEGDLVAGKEAYERAEMMAGGSSDGNLTASVRQKMHLELGRAYVRRGRFEEASVEVSRGLSVVGGREYYRRDLALLKDELSR